MLLEVDSENGSVQESKDEDMIEYFKEKTQLMTHDVDQAPKWRSHIGVEKEDGKTSINKFTNDFS